MKAGRIILIDVLDDPPYNITEIFRSVLESVGVDGNLVVGINGLGNSLDIPEDISMLGAIISGSVHHIVEDCNKEWGRSLLQFIRQYFNQIPILGVCYGHQALAYAMGGRVEPHKIRREIGSVQIYTTKEARFDSLFSEFKSGGFVQESHLDQVVTLPNGATLLAYNEHSSIQAFRIGKSWGVQFHPELIPSVFSHLLGGRVKSLFANNQKEDANKLYKVLNEIKECPMSVDILKKFVLHCQKGGKND